MFGFVHARTLFSSRYPVILGGLVLGLAGMACQSGELDESTPEPTVAPTSTPAPTATPTPEPTPTPIPGEGTLSITFGWNDDWAEYMNEPPVGRFYGEIYNSEDVDSGTGPEPGAEALESLELDVDLTGGTTAVLYQTGLLKEGEVYVLGFLDSDGSSLEGAMYPDSGELVTLPGDNDFDVVADTDTTIRVYFDLVLTN